MILHNMHTSSKCARGLETPALNTRVNQEVKASFKLRGNRDSEELVHCAVLTILDNLWY